METTTTFDLNRQVANWRQTLSHSPAIRVETLDELECHLRDSVEGLEGKGLSTEEAFFLAARRVGPVEPLKSEFAKVNPAGVWLHRVLWMLIGLQVWTIISSISRLVADGVLLGGATAIGSALRPEAGAWQASLLPGGLFLVTKIGVIILLLAGCWLAIKSWENRPASSRGSMKPSSLILCLVGLGLAIFGLHAATGVLLPVFAARLLSVEEYGGLAVAKSVASMAMFVIQTVALVAVTALLATRLFGSAQKARASA